MEHQWWCRDDVPCVCTDEWKKEQEEAATEAEFIRKMMKGREAKHEQKEKAEWATHMAGSDYCPACVKHLGIPDDWDEHDKRIMLRRLRAIGMTYAGYEAAWSELIKEQILKDPVIFKAITDEAIRKFGMMRR